ncbi:MAG TPA: glycosyltransferase family A protein [Pirellulales bacterium]
MPLALITPTRRRWHWLRKQARAIAGQLAPDDCWIIIVDNDQANQRAVNEIAELIPARQLTWLHASYTRPEPPMGCVNRLRNAATALAPARHDIVEVDDHDLLAPYALAEIRMALAAGYDYVFGWYHQQAVVESSLSLRERVRVRADEVADYSQLPSALTPALSRRERESIEPWPDVRHRYSRGAFERREIDGIGVRAFQRWLWTKLGGWAAHVWPGGDYHFALRAEAIGAKIVCIEQPLCTVTIEAESISASFARGPWRLSADRTPSA